MEKLQKRLNIKNITFYITFLYVVKKTNSVGLEIQPCSQMSLKISCIDFNWKVVFYLNYISVPMVTESKMTQYYYNYITITISYLIRN